MSAETPPAWIADALSGVHHGFFGREGGVSQGVYASLNAGTGSNDDPAAIAENRRRIAAAFGAPPSLLVGVHQVHSSRAIHAESPWAGERPHADALVTTRPGLVISVLTADCAPILLADAQSGVIGAAHAGWRGALEGVLDSVIALMQKHGASPERIAAAIGPCIHQASYEVGSEFEARFVDADPAFESYFATSAGGRRLFDLPGFCAARLKALGLARVETIALDTYTRPAQLHSYRWSTHEKTGDYGRNCAAIML